MTSTPTSPTERHPDASFILEAIRMTQDMGEAARGRPPSCVAGRGWLIGRHVNVTR